MSQLDVLELPLRSKNLPSQKQMSSLHGLKGQCFVVQLHCSNVHTQPSWKHPNRQTLVTCHMFFVAKSMKGPILYCTVLLHPQLPETHSQIFIDMRMSPLCFLELSKIYFRSCLASPMPTVQSGLSSTCPTKLHGGKNDFDQCHASQSCLRSRVWEHVPPQIEPQDIANQQYTQRKHQQHTKRKHG